VTGRPELHAGSLLPGLRALIALAEAGAAGLQPGELASAAEAPESALPALLDALAAAGFVLRNPVTGACQLGPGAARLADAYFPFAGAPYEALRQLARPVVEQALAASSEAVFLSVRSGHELLYLDAVMPPSAVRMVGRPGDRDLLHATSQGKALLAFLPPGRRDEIVQYLRLDRITAHTLTDRKRLLAELEQVRLQGFALQNEEREPGIRAVAAPVLDSLGYPIAAICLAGPSSRLGSSDLEGRLADIATAAARQIGVAVQGARAGGEGDVA
jgi:IclR family transcriptional regulator, acetate operon repressor